MLSLSHNKIGGLDARLFEYVENIEELYLDNNPLEVLDESTVAALQGSPKLKVSVSWVV